MFRLKIFVRVQTFGRVPPMLPRNFCHPGGKQFFKDLNLEKNVYALSIKLIHKINGLFSLLDFISVQTELRRNIGKKVFKSNKKIIYCNQIPLFIWSKYPGLFHLTQIFSTYNDFSFTCLPNLYLCKIPYISILRKSLNCAFVTNFYWAKTAKERKKNFYWISGFWEKESLIRVQQKSKSHPSSTCFAATAPGAPTLPRRVHNCDRIDG